ncbi:MAG: DUF4252 domain-containing protein [Flavobacteriaceae bacterium]|nr:DUF4252 domain-containing protein [Flavobacteriaceae bacterium]
MKKYYSTFLTIILSSNILFAQDIFEKFYDTEDVTYVSISDQLFKILASMQLELDTPADQEIYDIISGITSFKLIESKNIEVNKELQNWLNSCVKEGFVELMNVRDNQSDVRFYVKQGNYEKTFEQFVMYVSNPNIHGSLTQEPKNIETVVFSLEGDIDLDKIRDVANRIDFPGAEIIEKSLEKKIQ